MAHNLNATSPEPDDGYPDSPYRPLIEWQLDSLRDRISDAFDPEIVAELFVTIANSNKSRLRWPADPIAEKVLKTMLAQYDKERDEFLRDVAGSDWWSQGAEAPPKNM